MKVLRRAAFTLIEVLIAVALLAASVVTVLSMIPALTKHGQEALTRYSIEGLPAGLTSELRRLAQSDFDGLAARIPVMGSPLPRGWPLVATRTGDRIMTESTAAAESSSSIPIFEHYYLIECWRYADEPLRFTSDKDFLALHVRVSWPYRIPDGTGTGALTIGLRDRSERRFTVSITR